MADSGDGFFKGLLIGGALGAIAGVLLAPKSGKEIREQLSEEKEKLLSKSKDDIESAKKVAMYTFEKSMDKILDKMRPQEPLDEGEEAIAAEPKPVKKKPVKKTKISKSKSK